MMAPYALRLACLMFAAFFLVHLVLACAARWLLPAALRAAEKMRPAAAANLLFLLGVMPAGLSALAVLGLCLPAFLWLEPGVEHEAMGGMCGLAAVLGCALLAESAVRAARASHATARRMRELRQAGREMVLGQERAWVVDCNRPLFGVIGILTPRLVVSRAVLEALPADQFELAVRHEAAHRQAGDNLKRLLLLAAPGRLPRAEPWRELTRSWSLFAERAADARAVEGPPERSVALAEGLLRLARLGSAPPAGAALYTPFIQDAGQLSSRVEFLLRSPVAAAAPAWWRASGVTLGALGLLLAMRFPQTLRTVHELLEELLALNFFYDLW